MKNVLAVGFFDVCFHNSIRFVFSPPTSILGTFFPSVLGLSVLGDRYYVFICFDICCIDS